MHAISRQIDFCNRFTSTSDEVAASGERQRSRAQSCGARLRRVDLAASRIGSGVRASAQYPRSNEYALPLTALRKGIGLSTPRSLPVCAVAEFLHAHPVGACLEAVRIIAADSGQANQSPANYRGD